MAISTCRFAVKGYIKPLSIRSILKLGVSYGQVRFILFDPLNVFLHGLETSTPDTNTIEAMGPFFLLKATGLH